MDEYNRGDSFEYNGKTQIELSDDYDHRNNIIEYVVENVLQTTNTDSILFHQLRDEFNAFYANQCECEPNEDDSCIKYKNCRHGENYIIYNHENNDRQELILNENRKSHDIIYECTKFCSCSQNCFNRLVQFGPRKHLQIADFTSSGKQFGLITLLSIPKGGFVCEYAGEVLCKCEAIRRLKIIDNLRQMNYIICLNEYPASSGHSNENLSSPIQTFVDPSQIGNIGRYLNHSCDPNCEIISVRVDGCIPKLCMSRLIFFYFFSEDKIFKK